MLTPPARAGGRPAQRAGHAGASIVAHPTLLAALELARRLALPVSEPTIRAAFAVCDEAPGLRLAEIQEVFDALGIPAAAFESHPDDLPALPLPLIAGLFEAVDAANDAVILVVLTEWQPDGVRLVNPLSGEQFLEWPRFLARWNGRLFAASADGARREPGLAQRVAAHRDGLADYRASIRRFEQLLSAGECDALIAYCERGGLFARSVVKSHFEEQHEFVSGARTSDSALIRDRESPRFARIYDRVASLLGIGVAEIEDLQCVRYAPGQQFEAHVDGAHRTFTLLVYLNDDFAGGETLFPDLELTVKPEKGLGILFRNVGCDGTEIAAARHAGLPPSSGRKYAANIWIRCRPDHQPPSPARQGVPRRPARAASRADATDSR